VRVLDQKIAGLDQKIDSLRTEFTVEIRRVDTRIDGSTPGSTGWSAR